MEERNESGWSIFSGWFTGFCMEVGNFATPYIALNSQNSNNLIVLMVDWWMGAVLISFVATFFLYIFLSTVNKVIGYTRHNSCQQ